jgi:molybdenum cofactor cytidylyltransferase
MIAAIVLAAGGSSRMGRPKMLLPLGPGTVLSAAVKPLLAADLDRVIVVLGAEAETVRQEARLPDDRRLRFAVNESWREGMAVSLRRGLSACPTAEAVLIALGDQPTVSSDLVRRILAAWTPAHRLVVPLHGSRAVHPVLFSRALFPELRALAGDVGAREVVRCHWHEALFVEADPPRDIDTAEDYQRLLEGGPPPKDEGLARSKTE